MKKLLLVIGIPFAIMLWIAAVPGPPSTEYTRGLMVTTNAVEARTYLGVSSGGSSPTNVADTYYVTNIYATNITVNNNLTVSNLFVQNGSHNTMVITNNLVLQPVKTNILATTSTGLVTNLVIGTGLSYDPATRTLSSTGGSGVTTDVTTLAWSGTNITGFDCTTNGESFYLLVTNNCLFGAATFSNLPAKTVYKTYALCLQMDGTGGYIVKITNSIVGWEDGSTGGQPTIKTQANAVSYVYFHTGLATNSTLVGTPNLNVQ